MLGFRRYLKVLLTKRSIRSDIRSGRLPRASLGRLATETELFILGNGPSLGSILSQYWQDLANRPLFCVNSMASTEFFLKLRPRYYALADPLYWSEELFARFGLPIEQNRDLPFFHHIHQIDALLTSLSTLVDWEMDFFLPGGPGPERLIRRLEHNRHITFHRFPVGTTRSGDLHQDLELVEQGYSSVGAQNVLVCAVYLAVISKVSKIFLLGADHSFHNDLVVNDQNLVCTRDSHFYENEEQANLVPSYVDLAKTKTLTMNEWFLSMAEMFGQHARLQRIADHLGVRVLNLTAGSFVDAYPRSEASLYLKACEP